MSPTSANPALIAAELRRAVRLLELQGERKHAAKITAWMTALENGDMSVLDRIAMFFAPSSDWDDLSHRFAPGENARAQEIANAVVRVMHGRRPTTSVSQARKLPKAARRSILKHLDHLLQEASELARPADAATADQLLAWCKSSLPPHELLTALEVFFEPDGDWSKLTSVMFDDPTVHEAGDLARRILQTVDDGRATGWTRASHIVEEHARKNRPKPVHVSQGVATLFLWLVLLGLSVVAAQQLIAIGMAWLAALPSLLALGIFFAVPWSYQVDERGLSVRYMLRRRLLVPRSLIRRTEISAGLGGSRTWGYSGASRGSLSVYRDELWVVRTDGQIESIRFYFQKARVTERAQPDVRLRRLAQAIDRIVARD